MDPATRDAAEAHFQKRADALMKGAFRWLIKQYRFPFAVFEGASLSLEMTPRQTRRVLEQYRKRILQDGVARIFVTLQALEPSQGGRFKASTLWEFQSASGAPVYRANYNFFGTMRQSGSFIAEMMEYEDAGDGGRGDLFGNIYLH